MAKNFKKLMRLQVQNTLTAFTSLANQPRPPVGWVKTIRAALGMSSQALAKRLRCSQTNVIAMEKRETQGNITLETLEQVAAALQCKLVYALVPEKSLEQILTAQAHKVAQRQIKAINHSMSLEQQGLTNQQLQQQEAALVAELLEGNLKELWEPDEI